MIADRFVTFAMLSAVTIANPLIAAPAPSTAQPAPAARHEQVVAYDYQEKDVYHSPQTPGWTAWVALWKLRGGDVMLSFSQIIGDVKRPPNYNMAGLKKATVILRSADGGKKWQAVATIPSPEEPKHPWVYGGANFAAVLELADGSLLGTRYGRDWDSWSVWDGLIFRSSDGGKTWSEPTRFNDPADTAACPSRMQRLRDGTIMLAYQGLQTGYPEEGPWANSGVYYSHDEGKTWEGPDIIAHADDGLVAYPEPSFVEFEDGQLLFLFRIETFPDPKDRGKCISTPRRQCLVRKRRGRYEAGPIKETPLPHAGHPELLLTREGILLYLCENGYWSSIDRGAHWVKMSIPPSPYYPQAVQLDDGRVLVAGHIGADDPFPPPKDMSIRCQWFRVRKENK